MAHTKLGDVVLDNFKELCSEHGVVEKTSKLEGRSLSMFIAPKQAK